MRVSVLIEGAVDSELDVLTERFGPARAEDLGGWTAMLCRGGVAILNTGIGVANAAAATALACAQLKPDVVISQGTAGAHDIGLHTGDVVIGARIVRLGAYRSSASHQGVAPLEWQPLGPDGDVCDEYALASDAELVRRAAASAERLGYGKPGHARSVVGTVGSGDVWNCEYDMIAHLNSVRGTLCEEMETMAAAQVCARVGVPFLSLRVISNNERMGESYAPAVARELQVLTGALAEEIVRKFNE